MGNRKYFVNEEMAARVRAAYQGGRAKLTVCLNALEVETGFPRQVFEDLAAVRGWSPWIRRRLWTPEETRALRDYIGIMGVRRIARRLKRSERAISVRIQQLGLSQRVTTGYTLLDLQRVFAATYPRVRGWYDRRLLGRAEQDGVGIRIPEANVVRFIRQHPHEYNLARVDQVWFKSVVFARYA